MAFWDTGTALVAACPSLAKAPSVVTDGRQPLPLAGGEDSSAPPPAGPFSSDAACLQPYPPPEGSMKGGPQLLGDAGDPHGQVAEFGIDRQPQWAGSLPLEGLSAITTPPNRGSRSSPAVDQTWRVGAVAILDPADTRLMASSLGSLARPGVIHAPPRGGWWSDDRGSTVLEGMQNFGTVVNSGEGVIEGTTTSAEPLATSGQTASATGGGDETCPGQAALSRLGCKPVQMWIRGVAADSAGMEGIAIAPNGGPLLVRTSDGQRLVHGFQQEGGQSITAASCVPCEMPLAAVDGGGDCLTTWIVGSERLGGELLAASSATAEVALPAGDQLSERIVCRNGGAGGGQELRLNVANPIPGVADLLTDGNGLHLLHPKPSKRGIADIVQRGAVSTPLGNMGSEASQGNRCDQGARGGTAAHAQDSWGRGQAKLSGHARKGCEDGYSEHSSNTFCDSSVSKSPSQKANEESAKALESRADPRAGGVGLRQKSSAYIGVSKHRRSGRWEAHIWINEYGRQVYLGGYDRPEDAACAYDVVAIKSKGLKSSTNFNMERYLVLAEWLRSQSLQEVVTNVRRISRGFSRGTSKYRGVTLHPSGRWESRIGIHGNRHIYLGLYEDQDEAARHYDHALVRLKGLKAVTNFGLNLYNRQLEEHKWMQQNMKNGGVQNGPTYERWIKLGGMNLPPQCSTQPGSETQENCSNGSCWN